MTRSNGAGPQADPRVGARAGLQGAALGGAAALVLACTPTVRVEAPDEPIQINLNVRIDQEVRITLDRELEQIYQQNPDIF